MQASVIIPTYNRSRSLRRTLESLAALDMPKDDFEVVIVDNNSNDDTPEVAQAFSDRGLHLTYVVEKRLSFTVARHTGAAAAAHPVLCYIDDDVVVDPGWLRETVRLFEADPRAGMVAGRIEAEFETTPPRWARYTQRYFNGWSLWNIADTVCDCPGACGPSLAVRKDVLDEVGGFPPDTIGGESQLTPGTIEKVYVGPGDWGLNRRVRKAGYKIMYSPRALVHHVVPAVRMTEAWWRSRFIGEGYMMAFTRQIWSPSSPPVLALKSIGETIAGAGGYLLAGLLTTIRHDARYLFRFGAAYMFTKAKVHRALARDPGLAQRLWDIAMEGIDPADIDRVTGMVP